MKNKVLFREHRGGLIDSMETVTQIISIQDIKNIFPYKIDDVEIKYYGYDKRIKWQTYIVTGIIDGNRVVLGFCNKLLKN